MLNHLKLVAECKEFDYLGQIDDKKIKEILENEKEFSMEETVVKPVEFTGKKFLIIIKLIMDMMYIIPVLY